MRLKRIAKITIQQRKDAKELKEMIENQTYESVIDQLRFNSSKLHGGKC